MPVASGVDRGSGGAPCALREPVAASVDARCRTEPQGASAHLAIPGVPGIAQASTPATGRRGADGVSGLAVDAGYADQAHLNRECLRAETSIRRIARTAPSVKVVILTMHRDNVLKRQLMSAGASGYMTKDAQGFELVEIILTAHHAKPIARAHEAPADGNEDYSAQSCLIENYRCCA